MLLILREWKQKQLIDNKIIQLEKVLLVGVIHRLSSENIVKEHLDELQLLVKTAGAKVMGRVTQKISRINPATFLGLYPYQ